MPSVLPQCNPNHFRSDEPEYHVSVWEIHTPSHKQQALCLSYPVSAIRVSNSCLWYSGWLLSHMLVTLRTACHTWCQHWPSPSAPSLIPDLSSTPFLSRLELSALMWHSWIAHAFSPLASLGLYHVPLYSVIPSAGRYQGPWKGHWHCHQIYHLDLALRTLLQ